MMAQKVVSFIVIGAAMLALATAAVAQQDAAPVVPSAPMVVTPQGDSTAQADDTRGIEDVIAMQLQAFRSRNVKDAWRFASPSIQGMFGSSSNFGKMVSEGYPMVWDNSEVRFLRQEKIARWQVQTVMVQDAFGALHLLEYRMINTDNGWLIDGVTVLPSPDVGA